MAHRQTVSRLARFVVLFLVFCPFTMEAEDSSSAFVGEFSNVRHTAEHAYGYSVTLWKDGDQLFGLFSAANGLAGDSPVGLLENVQLDRATGKLSFIAKLSVAAVYLGHGKQEPTHDVFSFKGSLSHDVISGVLTHEEQHQTKPRPVVTRIRLPKLGKSDQGSAFQPSSYAQWRASVDPMLKSRGPKW